jgi:hypothetical protein
MDRTLLRSCVSSTPIPNRHPQFDSAIQECALHFTFLLRLERKPKSAMASADPNGSPRMIKFVSYDRDQLTKRPCFSESLGRRSSAARRCVPVVRLRSPVALWRFRSKRGTRPHFLNDSSEIYSIIRRLFPVFGLTITPTVVVSAKLGSLRSGAFCRVGLVPPRISFGQSSEAA